MKNTMRILVLSIVALTLTASVSEAGCRKKKKGHCAAPAPCAPVATCGGCH